MCPRARFSTDPTPGRTPTLAAAITKACRAAFAWRSLEHTNGDFNDTSSNPPDFSGSERDQRLRSRARQRERADAEHRPERPGAATRAPAEPATYRGAVAPGSTTRIPAHRTRGRRGADAGRPSSSGLARGASAIVSSSRRAGAIERSSSGIVRSAGRIAGGGNRTRSARRQPRIGSVAAVAELEPNQ